MSLELHHADYTALATFHEELQRLVASHEYCTRQAGLNPQHYPVLLAIKRKTAAGEVMTIGGLATELGLDRTSVVELVDDLVRRGLVSRSKDPADRRRVLVSMTTAGEQWLAPLAADALRELSTSGLETV